MLLQKRSSPFQLVTWYFLFVITCSLAAAQQESFGTIDKISFDQQNEAFLITFEGTNIGRCQPTFRENPPQLILEFPNIEYRPKLRFLKARENLFAERVRVLSSGGSEGLTRIAVDLKGAVNYTCEAFEKGVILNLNPSAQKTVKSTRSAQVTNSQPSPVPTSSGKTVSPSVGKTDDSFGTIIGPEDLLEINVFMLPQFSTTTRVLADGTISMPLIGSVIVSGLTREATEAKIAQALKARYVSNPNVSVNIKEYKSRQISVLGAVKNPGAFYLHAPRTLMQVLSDAGGLNVDAGGVCLIFRQKTQKIEVNLQELMTGANAQLNITILPGDVINIPVAEKIFVYVLGAVKSPGAVETTSSRSLTLLAALATVGGPLPEANMSGIQIKRKDAAGNETIVKVNVKDILKGSAPDVTLQANDVINVPKSFF